MTKNKLGMEKRSSRVGGGVRVFVLLFCFFFSFLALLCTSRKSDLTEEELLPRPEFASGTASVDFRLEWRPLRGQTAILLIRGSINSDC